MGDKDVHDLATQLAKQRISPEDFKQKDYERECEEFLRSKNVRTFDFLLILIYSLDSVWSNKSSAQSSRSS